VVQKKTPLQFREWWPGAPVTKGVFNLPVPDGTAVPTDTTVTLVVGQGTEKIKVPQLAGLTRDEAQNKLGGVGLIGDIKVVPSDLPEDEVVSTSPDAGIDVPINSHIVVNVSDGSVRVPNVVGMTEDAARNALKDFRVSVIEEVSSKDPGTVLRSNPPAGALLKKNSSITLVVAKKAPEPTPTVSPTPSPTPPLIP